MPDAPPAPPTHRPATRGAWLLGAVLYPFALTRAALLLTSWYATQFASGWTYPAPVSATRGWSWSRARWLDVWGKYDTGWYLDLAAHGYAPPADLAHQMSNLAFFPLYPWLVRGLHALLPRAWQGDEARFLLLAAATLLLAGRGRWWLAGACGILLGLARPSGVVVALPLAWMYLEARGFSLSRLRPDALAILGAPLGLAAHGVHLAHLTGDPLAVFHAQAAWGRALATPWRTLLDPSAFHPYMGHLERAAAILVLALGLVLVALRQAPLALFTLASLAPILLSGTLMSATRLLVGAFPAFAALAWLGRREPVDRAVVITFTVAQAFLFFAWSRFYW